MVIDFHYHVLDRTWYHDNWWRGLAKSAVQILKSAGIEMNAEEIIDVLLPQVCDPTGQKLVSNMDQIPNRGDPTANVLELLLVNSS